MSESEFWSMTDRKMYALIVGSNANNGARTDYDDMSSLGGDEEVD